MKDKVVLHNLWVLKQYTTFVYNEPEQCVWDLNPHCRCYTGKTFTSLSPPISSFLVCPILCRWNNDYICNGAQKAALWYLMVQQLRALAARPENLSSITSTHMGTHNHLELQFRRIRHPLLASVGTRCTSGAQTYCQQNTCAHEIIFFKGAPNSEALE